MLDTATFEDFLDGKVAVLFRHSKSPQFRELMEKCNEYGLMWYSGNMATRFSPSRGIKHLTISTYKRKLVYDCLESETLPLVNYKNLIF